MQETHCGSPQAGKDFIKRAIAIPGDTVEITDGVLIINGKRMKDEPYALYDSVRLPPPPESRKITREQYQQAWVNRELDKVVGDLIRDNFGPVTVPPDSYFVMGDPEDEVLYWLTASVS